MRPRILIVEDHDDFRTLVKAHLRNQGWKALISEANTGENGVRLALRESPHVILMDIRLPGISGIEAASRIKAARPECEVIVLTMFETDSFKSVFQTDDISAYIGKSELFDKLVPMITSILRRQDRRGGKASRSRLNGWLLTGTTERGALPKKQK